MSDHVPEIALMDDDDLAQPWAQRLIRLILAQTQGENVRNVQAQERETSTVRA